MSWLTYQKLVGVGIIPLISVSSKFLLPFFSAISVCNVLEMLWRADVVMLMPFPWEFWRLFAGSAAFIVVCPRHCSPGMMCSLPIGKLSLVCKTCCWYNMSADCSYWYYMFAAFCCLHAVCLTCTLSPTSVFGVIGRLPIQPTLMRVSAFPDCCNCYCVHISCFAFCLSP